MNMTQVPFGHTLLLWRLERGLTQTALAKQARMSRPNLSAVERGKREVSLTTLRALALTLGIRPGVLADGVAPPPAQQERLRLSRAALERIADAVAFDRQVSEPDEQSTVEALRTLFGHRTQAVHRRWSRPRAGRRVALAAWVRLKSLYGRAAIQTFADRVLERQRA